MKTKKLPQARPEATKAPRASQPHSKRAARPAVATDHPEKLTLEAILSRKALARLTKAAAAFYMEPQAFAEKALATWIHVAEKTPCLIDPDDEGAARYACACADKLFSELLKRAYGTADPCARHNLLAAIRGLICFHPSYLKEAELIETVLDAELSLVGGGALERGNEMSCDWSHYRDVAELSD